MEMLNQAFLKGMEEASKLLPTTSSSRDRDMKQQPHVFNSSARGRKNRHDDWDGGETSRSCKLLVPEPEETGEMVDQMVTQGRALCLDQLKRLSITMAAPDDGSPANKKNSSRNTVVDLRTSLLHCAQSVSMDDRRGAAELLRQIKRQSSPTGDANQRLAYCFAEGLEARLAGTGSHLYRSLMERRTSLVDFLRAYQLYLATTCFNMSKSKKKKKLHIVDYGVQYGCQWPSLIDALSKRKGGPPEVRMTCIDVPKPGFRPAARIQETGRRLSDFAARCGLPFEFRSVVAATWETVRAEDLDIRPDDDDEVLVVNSTTRFQNFMDHEGGAGDDVHSPSPRDVVLGNIRRMKPDVFILSVVNGSYNSPFFLPRFREALFYYSAMFDILDATAPRDDEQRLVVERDLIGRCALNVVACEGADRVERPETYRQWQARCRRVGLRQLPPCPDAVQVLSERVSKYYHRDFVVDVDGHWILQGWKGRIFYAMSTWILSGVATVVAVAPSSSDAANTGPADAELELSLPRQQNPPRATNEEHTRAAAAAAAAAALSPADADVQHGALLSALFGGGHHHHHNGGDDEADMIKLAFLKGMEEANKFLPTTSSTSSLLIGSNSSPTTSGCGEKINKKHGKNKRRTNDEDDSMSLVAGTSSGRNTKLMVLQVSMPPEQQADGEMVAQIIINEFNVCIADLKTSPFARNEGDLDLHTLLIHCARAVGSNDRASAAKLLAQIKKQSSPRGDPSQRLAHCFAQELAARLAGTGTQAYRSALVSKRRSSSSDVEYLKAYRLYLESCCFRMTSFSFANWSILKAVAARRKKVHIVDYGIDFGAQWPTLLTHLSTMEGGPPEVRITGIDTGRRLSSCARQLGVPFKFQSIVSARWETIRADDLGIDPDELLVVNSLGSFGRLIDDGGGDVGTTMARSPRDAVLDNIRGLRPDLFILGIANGSYSSPFFVTRFREALSYYTALFDMLDATIPRDKEQRLLVERELFGSCAMNAVACEGWERVERPEAYRQWQTRNHRAGLRQLPLDQEIVQYVRDKIRTLFHRDFVIGSCISVPISADLNTAIDTDQQWLLKGWKGRILYAISTWVADDDSATCT
ncbi:hypothetical protein U9M48_000229 [Paspalum notatum var. saurae]|uniref:Uncharacterized protein n=1 Tax=Paspalum notatum var. saurae TaxID=547442 RepID=A0AAQ3PF15_PASNO